MPPTHQTKGPGITAMQQHHRNVSMLQAQLTPIPNSLVKRITHVMYRPSTNPSLPVKPNAETILKEFRCEMVSELKDALPPLDVSATVPTKGTAKGGRKKIMKQEHQAAPQKPTITAKEHCYLHAASSLGKLLDALCEEFETFCIVEAQRAYDAFLLARNGEFGLVQHFLSGSGTAQALSGSALGAPTFHNTASLCFFSFADIPYLTVLLQRHGAYTSANRSADSSTLKKFSNFVGADALLAFAATAYTASIERHSCGPSGSAVGECTTATTRLTLADQHEAATTALLHALLQHLDKHFVELFVAQHADESHPQRRYVEMMFERHCLQLQRDMESAMDEALLDAAALGDDEEAVVLVASAGGKATTNNKRQAPPRPTRQKNALAIDNEDVTLEAFIKCLKSSAARNGIAASTDGTTTVLPSANTASSGRGASSVTRGGSAARGGGGRGSVSGRGRGNGRGGHVAARGGGGGRGRSTAPTRGRQPARRKKNLDDEFLSSSDESSDDDSSEGYISTSTDGDDDDSDDDTTSDEESTEDDTSSDGSSDEEDAPVHKRRRGGTARAAPSRKKKKLQFVLAPPAAAGDALMSYIDAHLGPTTHRSLLQHPE